LTRNAVQFQTVRLRKTRNNQSGVFMDFPRMSVKTIQYTLLPCWGKGIEKGVTLQ